MSFRLISRKSLLPVFVAAAAVLGAYSVVSTAVAQDGQRQAGQGRGPSLESAMKQVERSYKALARQLDDPAKDSDSLRAISMLQAGVATAKAAVPHIVEDKPEAERPAMLAEYRKMMLDLLKTAIDLEEKLVAGDRAGAKAALEKIHEMEEAGHKKFMPEDHDHDHNH